MIQNISNTPNVNQLGQSTYEGGKTYSQHDLKFEKIFKEKLNQNQSKELQFSKHAALRVEERGIQVTTGLMDSLNQAVEKARSKGARDVVIFGESNAFIVNVPNNVVVTTLSGSEMKENIFTNIDSAVML